MISMFSWEKCMFGFFSRLVFVASCLLATLPSFAESTDQDDWTKDWTVVTLAQNGAWGAATDDSLSHAIATARRDCMAMAVVLIDCGAKFTAIRGGWTLGVLCGTYSIIVAERDLSEAEAALRNREAELASLHVDLAPCERVLTVDPTGAIRVERPHVVRAQ
jgi:hypothetical protein